MWNYCDVQIVSYICFLFLWLVSLLIVSLTNFWIHEMCYVTSRSLPTDVVYSGVYIVRFRSRVHRETLKNRRSNWIRQYRQKYNTSCATMDWIRKFWCLALYSLWTTCKIRKKVFGENLSSQSRWVQMYC